MENSGPLQGPSYLAQRPSGSYRLERRVFPPLRWGMDNAD